MVVGPDVCQSGLVAHRRRSTGIAFKPLYGAALVTGWY
ncbi:hypothetical protein C900_01505 [Fulvivirga imtechensis AK7]|uniref:Uncharacterized protein n=1 Tax=Fulvivirga imtechensis AK7 TaxID=1237149 RepID=L8JKL3_9BACT|nr:hypothetical protein C900_01505 [Fulvivirga imtechensis AK7]